MKKKTKTSKDLRINKELIKQSKDKIEEETGVFHWLDAKGNYIPVHEMSPEDIERAVRFSEDKMDDLQETIIKLHAQLHAWQYRIDRLNEERENKFDGISSRALSQSKELTE